jgi:hypothetical protein
MICTERRDHRKVAQQMVIEPQRKDRNDGFDVDFLPWFSVILCSRAAKPYLFFRGPTESCASGNPSRQPLRSLYVGAPISSTPATALQPQTPAKENTSSP